MAYIKVPLKNVISVEKIITIFEHSVRSDYRFEGETHDFMELNYVLEGEVLMHYGGKQTRMREGEICFHKPGAFHDLCGNGESPARVIIISFECNSSVMNFFDDRIITVPEHMRKKLSEMLALAYNCLRHSKKLKGLVRKPDAPFGAEQLLRGELESFFIRLIQSEEQGISSFFTSRDELIDKLTSDIKQYLEKNIHARPNLDKICEHFHFSRSQICHAFKSKTGLGVMHYFLKLKICEGERLLCDTNMTVTDIAEHLAFESSQYFARIFKKETGKTPTEFRRNSKEK